MARGLTQIQQAIVSRARGYLGQKETANNRGFQNAEFEHKLRLCGWRPGLAWCAFFCELVWIEALSGLPIERITWPNHCERLELARTLFMPGARATFTAFRDLGRPYFAVRQTPSIGSIAAFGRPNDWRGHVGIVFKYSANTFSTICGNTGANRREGDSVRINHWRNEGTPNLRTLGFVEVIET